MTARLLPLLTWRSALADSDLTATERHVCLALSLYMNEKGGSAFPGIRRLAYDCNLSERAVQYALSGARQKGWLFQVEKGGSPTGGERRASVYAARIPNDQRSTFTGPPVENDQRTTCTGASDDTDRCTSRQGPVQEVRTNSELTLHRTRADAKSKADSLCVTCRGEGRYRSAVSGAEVDCPCTYRSELEAHFELMHEEQERNEGETG